MPIYVRMPPKAPIIKKRRASTDKKISLLIPIDYYRYLELFGKARKKSQYYREYRRVTDKLTDWLWDQAPAMYRIIRLHRRTVILEKTDCPMDLYWTKIVIEQLSDQFSLDGLSERARNDP